MIGEQFLQLVAIDVAHSMHDPSCQRAGVEFGESHAVRVARLKSDFDPINAIGVRDREAQALARVDQVLGTCHCDETVAAKLLEDFGCDGHLRVPLFDDQGIARANDQGNRVRK